jgi:hypothetical protein
MEKTLNKILENALNNDELIKGRDKHTWECGYLKGLVIGLALKFPEVAETLEKRFEFQEEKKERDQKKQALREKIKSIDLNMCNVGDEYEEAEAELEDLEAELESYHEYHEYFEYK